MGNIREKILGTEEQTINEVCRHLTNGGCILDLCEVWGVPYFEFMEWIHTNEEYSEKYEKALVDRDEWVKQRILKELKTLAFSNTKELFSKETGAIKNPSEWSDEIGASVESISITQKQKENENEESYKIKVHSKLKAIELYGKQMKMFTEKIEVEGEFKLEDVLAKVHRREESKK